MTALYAVGAEESRAAAKDLLSMAVRVHFKRELPQIAQLQGGKPWFPSAPEIYFNVSHSRDLALCGVGTCPLGVDIERVRPRNMGLPLRVLSQEEYDWFTARGAVWEDFCGLWTLKESLCKCTGEGLRVPPRQLHVPTLSPGEVEQFEGYTFRAYGGVGWRAAVCLQGNEAPPPDLIWNTR